MKPSFPGASYLRHLSSIRSFREWLATLPKPRSWLWLAGIAVAGFLGLYWDASAGRATEPNEPEAVEDATTFIPAGYVLVPIEIANFESLDSILGKFGVVDLYVPADTPRGRARKVAEQIKILRAPLNPSHFAVLVREADSARLVSHAGPYTVIVQNSKQSGTGIVRPDAGSEDERGGKGRRPSRITVEVSNASQGT